MRWPTGARMTPACGGPGTAGRAGEPPAGDRRPVAGGPSADGRRRARTAITFNGEIYNYRDLRAELEARGRRFRTASDTEVDPRGLRSVGRGRAGAPQRDVRVGPRRRAGSAGSCWRGIAPARSRCSIGRFGGRTRVRARSSRRCSPIRPRRGRWTATRSSTSWPTAMCPASGACCAGSGSCRRRTRWRSLDTGEVRLARTGGCPAAARAAGSAGEDEELPASSTRCSATPSAGSWSPTCRSACCSAAASIRAWSPRWRPAPSPRRATFTVTFPGHGAVRRKRTRAAGGASISAPTTPSCRPNRQPWTCCRSWRASSTSRSPIRRWSRPTCSRA